MTYSPLLLPVVVLVAWSLVMLIWMAARRFSAVKHTSVPRKRGIRGADLEGVLPDQANWPAHNYAHLMEQPTIFYAIVFALLLMGMDIAINVWLAWAYVVLRILHSIVQSTINKLAVRFSLFVLSSLCLVGLTVHAAARLLHG